MNIKLSVVKIALKTIIFIDFLENLPQKTVRGILKALVFGSLISFFIVLLLLEEKHNAVSGLASYVFVPRHRSSSYVPVAVYPAKVGNLPFPDVTSKSVLVIDLLNNEELFSKNKNERFPPASTTKLLTAKVALDTFELYDRLVVPEQCVGLETQSAGLVSGESLSVEDLVYMMLVNSAGDAACTLAYSAESYGKFIGLMNKYAYGYGAVNSNFLNPIGLDETASQHHSTAEDLHLISYNVMLDPIIGDAVKTQTYVSKTGSVERTVYNTNQLLWEIDGTVGVKTGRTYGAGEVLIYEYRNDESDLMIIVMGSQDRFDDTRKILGWARQNFVFKP
jgi:serine-type D-Ala-D-Ala carboxypeptidase (penicillin-binding protein 5/6)